MLFGFIEEEIEQLIIIGNGFDLRCGLKSKYSDFFEDYFKDLKFLEQVDNEKKIEDVIDSHVLTKNFWLNYFMRLHLTQIKTANIEDYPRTWADVEEIITNIIITLNDKYENFISYLNYKDEVNDESITNVLLMLSPYSKSIDIEENILKALNCFDFKKLKEEYKRYIKNKEYNDIKYVIKKDFFKKLYTDLLVFENRFLSYIKDQMSNNKEYYGMAEHVYAIISCLDVENGEKIYDHESEEFCNYLKDNVQVLSFNYTDPNKSHKMIDDIIYAKTFINIHGSINNSIIFGIDELSLKDEIGSFKDYDINSYEIYRFSKTYRDTLINDTGLVDLSNVEYIKIFGHGLGKADYSYFYSIFDANDLYLNKTKLIYYYDSSHYKEDEYDKQTIEEIEIDKVHSLIKSYGSTFNNKDHGFNLYHKLILEGRLLVKDIKKELGH